MSPEEKKSSHDDLERLDALWDNFRLPIPNISAAGEAKYYDDGDDLLSSGLDEWLLELLDLFRLLHTMDHQYANSAKDQDRVRTSRVMNSQVALAYSTLWRVERTCPFSPSSYENKSEEDSDRIFQRRVRILLQKARSRTEETCTRLRRWLDRPSSHPAQRHPKMDVPQERDLIHDIFLAPAQASINAGEDESELMDEFCMDEGNYDNEEIDARVDFTGQGSTHAQNQRHQTMPPPRIPLPEDLDPVKFQKQQQELLEEELASMASRLKSSTLAMNVTLKRQTKELDEMEHLAQTNLDQVTDTTTKVEARLAKQKRWKKQFATWSMIGTVIGVWVLCFMVMRTVPKRRIGKMNLFGRFRDGENIFSVTWNRYFSKDKGENMSGVGEAQRQEQQRRWQEWGQGYWQRQQEQPRAQLECEVSSDGTTTCYDSQDVSQRMEALADEIAAEHRESHIVKNMANAPFVDAVESGNASVKKEPIHDDGTHDESSDNDQDKSHISDDPMQCVPPTEDMIKHQIELDSLRIGLNQLEKAMDRLPVGSTKRLEMAKDRDELQSEMKNLSSVFEIEINKAISVNAKICEGEVLVGEFSKHEEGIEQDRVLTGRNAEQARLAENRHEQERLDERTEAEHLNHERLVEAAQIEVERMEQERLTAFIEKERVVNERMEEQQEAARLEDETLIAEAEKFKKEKRAKEEAERLNQERLVEAARMEQERLTAFIEKERVVNERMEEQQEAARLEDETLVAEAERLQKEKRAKEEAERLNQERLVEAAQMEQERLTAFIEKERVVNERMEEQQEAARLEDETLVAEAERLQKEKRAEEAQLKAERLERERLTALELTKQAEFEMLEEGIFVAGTAELEDENLSAEAERSKLEKLADGARLEAKEAIVLAMKIAAENSDFLPSDVRFAAGQQKNDLLAHYISVAPDMVEASDKSGWRPIHEAARAGNLAGIQLLVSAGCDLTSRTGRRGNGGTALWWAIQRFGEDHGAVKLLRYHGALDAGPEA